MGGIVFLGTAAFAVPSLERLVAVGEATSLVVTQPDRPSGRGRRPEPSPVKAAAERLALPVYQPDHVNDPQAVDLLRSLAPEFLVVVAYGQILRRALLDAPAGGTVNLHASLLPRHRGPSPVAWSILEGDPELGNTTMLVDEGLDSGPILLQEAIPLSPLMTRGDAEDILADRGATLLSRTLQGLRRGQIAPTPQDASRATWSRLISREMRVVHWSGSAAELRGRIHALSPSPGVAVRWDGRLVKVLRVAEAQGCGPPGQVLSIEREGPAVGCGEGALILREVQPEGKRPMSGADFARGGAVRIGSVLESPWDG